MSEAPISKATRGNRLIRHFPFVAGAVVALLGLVVMSAWFARWTPVIQIFPGLAPMKFNSALCFSLCGAGIMLLARKPAMAAFPGSVAASIGLLTLLEYLTDASFGIDELFATDFIVTATTHPGRMSLMTACSFCFSGAGVTMAGMGRRSWRLVASGLLGCVAAVIGGVAIFGYAAGLEAAYGWGAQTLMAIHTAAGHLLIGTALVVWTQRMSRLEGFNFARWLPLTASVALMAMVAIISGVSFSRLRESSDWRRQHGGRALMAAQAMMGHLNDVQRGLRGYVLTGQPAALDPYKSGTNNLPKAMSGLLELTREDPARQLRLKKVSTDLDAVIAYSQALLETRISQGLTAAIQLESSGQGLRVMDRVRDDLRLFNEEEERLLNQGAVLVEAEFNNTKRLLIYGSLLAALLLALANMAADREINRRNQTEAALQASENLLRQFILHSPAAIAMLDAELRYLQTSERWLKDYKLEGKSITGRSHYEVFPDIPQRWRDIHQRVLAGAVEQCSEDSFLRADGSTEWLQWEARPWFNARGRIGGLIFFTQVITERKRAEEVLRRTMSLQRAILDSADYAIISTTKEGVVTTFNSTAEYWLDYSSREVIGKATPALWHDEEEIARQAARLSVELGRTIKPGFEVFTAKVKRNVGYESEWTMIRKDGRRFPVTISASALVDESSEEITGYLGVISDITERKSAEEKLRASEQRFRHAFDGAPIGMALVNSEGRWIKVNRALQEMLGYSEAELLATDFQHITHPDDLEKDLGLVAQVLENKITSYQMEKRYFRKDGEVLFVMLSVSLVRAGNGDPLYFISQIENITTRKIAEETLRVSEERFSLAVNAAKMGVWDWDVRTNQITWDMRMYEIYGLPKGTSVRYEDWRNAVLAEDLPQAEAALQQAIRDKNRLELEFRIRRPDGGIRHIQAAESVILGDGKEVARVVGMNIDVTERKLAALKLEESLEEKEVLLREIHHRVKNNMQVISSILQLQKHYIKDPASLEIFNDCQGRIRTMALIHEKLYRSDKLARIDFKDYLENLVTLLFRSNAAQTFSLRHELQIEPVTLDVDTAVPLGLIANELVTNCLKHAFTGRQSGFVRVSLAKRAGDSFQLVVEDDGNGLPPGFAPEKAGSLGLRLVSILTSQINGTVEFSNVCGARLVIVFRNDPSPA